jgi:hypothetical protein
VNHIAGVGEPHSVAASIGLDDGARATVGFMPGPVGGFLEYFSLIKKGEAMKEEQPQQRLKGPADYRGARRTCAL